MQVFKIQILPLLVAFTESNGKYIFNRAGGRGFYLVGGGVGAKYKIGHLSKFSQQAPSTAHNVYFSGFLNSLEAKINFKLYLKHE